MIENAKFRHTANFADIPTELAYFLTQEISSKIYQAKMHLHQNFGKFDFSCIIKNRFKEDMDIFVDFLTKCSIDSIQVPQTVQMTNDYVDKIEIAKILGELSQLVSQACAGK